MQSIAWPLVLMVAWWLGDRLWQVWGVPRVVGYVLVGTVGSLLQYPSHPEIDGLFFVAGLALSLLMFELGYRINLHWFSKNFWLLATGLLQSTLVFLGTWYVASRSGFAQPMPVIAASMMAATCPAVIINVVNESHSAGQVTNRVLHLTFIHCLFAIFALMVSLGYWHMKATDSIGVAITSTLYKLLMSVLVGVFLGIFTPILQRQRPIRKETATGMFALAVLLMYTLSDDFKLSPLLAAVVFGIVARKRNMNLTAIRQDFGSIGELLSVFLFVYVALLITQADIKLLAFSVTVVFFRMAITVLCSVACAYPSGITLRKGLLTGLALSPLSVFAFMQLSLIRNDVTAPVRETLMIMAGLLIVLEWVGPLILRGCLKLAGEEQSKEARDLP